MPILTTRNAAAALALFAIVACSEASPKRSTPVAAGASAARGSSNAASPAGTHWVAAGGGLRSPDFGKALGQRQESLAVRLPARASDPFQVELGSATPLALSLRLFDVAPTAVELNGEHAVYREVAPGVDVKVERTPQRLEWSYLVRTLPKDGKLEFRTHLELPSSLHVQGRAAPLRLVDAQGQTVARFPAAWAEDANGTRRDVALSYEQQVLVAQLDTRGLVAPVLVDPALETLGWERLGPAQAEVIGSRSSWLAYDAQRDVFVQPGAERDGNRRWKASGFYAGRNGDYDPVKKQVVSANICGAGCVPNFAAVYAWNGLAMSPTSTNVADSDQSFEYGAFDSGRGVFAFFAPYRQSPAYTASNELWETDGNGLNLRSSSGPSARFTPLVGYDAKRAVLVVTGGYGPDPYTQLHDTWEWNGSAWTPGPTTGTDGNGSYNDLVWDSKNNRLVLLTPGTPLAYSGTTWTALPGTLEACGSGLRGAFDSKRNRLLAVCANSYGAENAIEREFDGTKWTNVNVMPMPRAGGAISFDTKRGRLVMFGGNSLTSTWEWDGTAWSRFATATPNRLGPALAYNDKDTVMFGGCSGSCSPTAPLANTQLWDGSAWRAGPTGPSGSYYSWLAFDPVRKQTVLYRHCPISENPCKSTWEWDGVAATWMDKFIPPLNPPPIGIAYDRSRQAVVAIGTGSLRTWNGTSWSASTATTGLTFNFSTSSDPSELKPPVVIAANAARGTIIAYDAAAGLTYELVGTTWRKHTLAPSPGGNLDTVAATWDAKNSKVLLFNGSELWSLSGLTAACSAGTDCASGNCVDGVCCEQATCGSCQRCNGATPGVCSSIVSAEDPDNCSGSLTCDATGACKTKRGQACGATPCIDGFCADGVCCNVACTGNCQSCTAAGRGTGQDGECGNAAANTDPRNKCTQDAAYPGSCKADGMCDGSGACRLNAVADVVCGTVTCAQGTLTGKLCNGSGVCGASTASCKAYVCNDVGDGCTDSCTKDVECATGAYCDDSQHCQLKQAQGAECTSGSECATGYCYDGVCCNQACGGQCEACNVEPNQGSCVPVQGEPTGDRQACEGEGSCKGRCNGGDRTTCSYPAAGTACAPGSCDGNIAQPPSTCDGTGTCMTPVTESCVPYGCVDEKGSCRASCSTDNDCAAGAACDMAKSKCVLVTNTCQDAFTIASSDGELTSCRPYHCEAGACQMQCSSADDCASSYDCVDSACVKADSTPSGHGGEPSGAAGEATTPTMGGSKDSGGCGCAVPGQGSRNRGSLASFALLGLLMASRGRRAFARERRRASSNPNSAKLVNVAKGAGAPPALRQPQPPESRAPGDEGSAVGEPPSAMASTSTHFASTHA